MNDFVLQDTEHINCTPIENHIEIFRTYRTPDTFSFLVNTPIGIVFGESNTQFPVSLHLTMCGNCLKFEKSITNITEITETFICNKVEEFLFDIEVMFSEIKQNESWGVPKPEKKVEEK
jgi:hypothetical protein